MNKIDKIGLIGTRINTMTFYKSHTPFNIPDKFAQ